MNAAELSLSPECNVSGRRELVGLFKLFRLMRLFELSELSRLSGLFGCSGDSVFTLAESVHGAMTRSAVVVG